jgi:hypothetical protein
MVRRPYIMGVSLLATKVFTGEIHPRLKLGVTDPLTLISI